MGFKVWVDFCPKSVVVEEFDNFSHQDLRLYGFCNVSLKSCLKCFLLIKVSCVSREGDRRNHAALMVRTRSNLLDQHIAIHFRHAHITH